MNTPEEAESYIARAELLYELTRFDEAREELAGGLLHYPTNAALLSLLAATELRAGQPKDALTAADAALAHDPSDHRALSCRGYALALLGRVDDAVEAAEKLLDADRLAWWRHMHYAMIRQIARNGQEALDAAWQAIRLAPDRPEPHVVLSSIAGQLGLADLSERASRAASRLGKDRGGDWDTDDFLHLQFDPELKLRPSTPPPDAEKPDTYLFERVAGVVRYGAAFPIAAPLLVALLSAGATGTARVLAAILAVAGGIGLFVAVSRLPEPITVILRKMDGSERWLEIAFACVAASPVVLGCYAAVASPFLLALTVLLGFVALYAFVMRGR
ncbi:hypothetical protein Afil01_17130 [Actinorhabdospora filicis]|uniref:Tetratricopeptide repeat protein n=1 Tax=Actinorhabdospora filicis TaxID=1785913 RepID=A0A9W6SJQ5_9ACTN|nr:hypothetical protein [Actinorhabdospora filicis]GLZ76906.1 hypothetical protein Afil01_17130 [Actinorhabdospora filicis]